jgi:hypothetical protein
MRDKIEYILNNFDFKKVNRVMTFLNWTWFPQNRVPDLAELRKMAESLLRQAINEKEKPISISTGGFEVISNNDEINLRFIIDESFIQR